MEGKNRLSSLVNSQNQIAKYLPKLRWPVGTKQKHKIENRNTKFKTETQNRKQNHKMQNRNTKPQTETQNRKHR